jgi:hypothetical protein
MALELGCLGVKQKYKMLNPIKTQIHANFRRDKNQR